MAIRMVLTDTETGALDGKVEEWIEAKIAESPELANKIASLIGSSGEGAEAVFDRVFELAAAPNIPTVAVSTASAFSSGTTTRPAAKSGDATAVDMAGDTHFRYDGTPSMSIAASFAQVPYVPAGPSEAGTVGSFVCRVHFLTPYTDRVEISFKPPQSAGNRYRLWVDGQPVTFESQALGNLTTAAEHYMLLTFPSAKVRTITWENPTRNLFGGVRLPSGLAPIRPARPAGLRIAFLGDSFTDGAGSPSDGATRIDTWAAQAARMFGAAEFALFGIGGSGYLATAVGHGPVSGKGPYSGRVASIVAYAPDVVIVLGSINDLAWASGYSTELQAAVKSVIDGLSTVPRVIVVGPPMPPYTKGGVPTDYGLVNEAVRAGALFAGREFVDPLRDTTNDAWIVPADLGSDNAHPKMSGHSKIARRVFGSIGALRVTTQSAAAPSGAPTTTTLASSNSNPTIGDAVNLTATVVPSGAGGTVQFKDGATILGTAAVSAGSATLTGAVLSNAGSRTLTATFLPSSVDYQTSTGVLSLSVLAAYSVGANDYAHRYLASKVPGSVGDIVTSVPDLVGGAPLVRVESNDTQFTIQETGGERFIRALQDGTGGKLSDGSATVGTPFTIAALIRVPEVNKIVFQDDAYNFSRAANGSFSITGAGTTSTNGSTTTPGGTAWVVAIYSGNGASSFLQINDTLVGAGSLTGPGVGAAFAGGQSTPSSSLATGVVQSEWVERIRWDRVLTSVEIATVLAAMRANSALV
ncbi:GDSL-type esterase/lipase family protein [Microbacterium sp. VKM Ac-2923]|uniref:GDSL-type esterase/lipase family protein n=1 Tax=Microbacterium sp. VKM Ac-2923 TaxID=2929476 RepID=UPI001FB28023|nr:GDSL-type esterase/lipase family protein [Microbacterium sp. VKM Ac-2923]MCJ1709217.1 GDSL-type esterase/lipase family protein [Microbacterium sp. VKM Ac-2923]